VAIEAGATTRIHRSLTRVAALDEDQRQLLRDVVDEVKIAS
jgi:hypothetical protein